MPGEGLLQADGTIPVCTLEVGSPPSLKRGIIKGELLRRLRLSDTRENWYNTVEDLWKKLEKQGYPREIFQKTLTAVQFADGRRLRLNLTEKLRNRRLQARFPFTSECHAPPKEPLIPLIIKYDPASLRVIKKRRRELEEYLNAVLAAYGQGVQRIRLINALQVGMRLGPLLNRRVDILNPEPPLEPRPSGHRVSIQGQPGEVLDLVHLQSSAPTEATNQDHLETCRAGLGIRTGRPSVAVIDLDSDSN